MSKRIYPTKGELKMLESYSNELAITLAVDVAYMDEPKTIAHADVSGKKLAIHKGINDWVKTIKQIKKEKKVKY